MTQRFNGMADVKIIDDKKEIEAVGSLAGKPFLRVTFEDGTVVDMSFTLAEMIGGVGAGANQRFGFVKGPDMGKAH